MQAERLSAQRAQHPSPTPTPTPTPPGAKYRLSFYYGRLQTYAWRNEDKGKFIKFETTMDAIARDAAQQSPMEKGQKTGAPYPQVRGRGPMHRHTFAHTHKHTHIHTHTHAHKIAPPHRTSRASPPW